MASFGLDEIHVMMYDFVIKCRLFGISLAARWMLRNEDKMQLADAKKKEEVSREESTLQQEMSDDKTIREEGNITNIMKGGGLVS